MYSRYAELRTVIDRSLHIMYSQTDTRSISQEMSVEDSNGRDPMELAHCIAYSKDNQSLSQKRSTVCTVNQSRLQVTAGKI
jgi:hypothetical protein